MWFSKKSRELKRNREKVFNMLMDVLSQSETVLNNKYQKTHGKVAIDYKGHVVEIEEDSHGEKFVIKFHKSKMTLTKKQYKKVVEKFDNEIKSRTGEVEGFEYLSKVLDENKCCKEK